jgi:hypothetical protein
MVDNESGPTASISVFDKNVLSYLKTRICSYFIWYEIAVVGYSLKGPGAWNKFTG